MEHPVQRTGHFSGVSILTLWYERRALQSLMVRASCFRILPAGCPILRGRVLWACLLSLFGFLCQSLKDITFDSPGTVPLSGPNNKEAQGPDMLKTAVFFMFLQETGNGLKCRREHASNWRQ